jgi:Domain of unknown function (DUF4397)
MKKSTIVFGLIFLTVLAGVFSCKRDMPLRDPANTPSGNSAFISLIDVSPNLDSILDAHADTFNVLFGGAKVTGYTAGTLPVMTFGGIYPLPGTANGYAAVPSGTQTITFANGVNNLDSTVLATLHETLQPNSYYSFIITDSVLSNRDSSRIFVKDTLLPVTPGFYNLRFVNAALNDTAGVDIWSARNNANIFTNVKPGGIIGFSSFASNWALSDTLFARRAGTSIGLDTMNTQTFYNLRTYTLVYKGNALSNSKTDPKRRHLEAYVNQ